MMFYRFIAKSLTSALFYLACSSAAHALTVDEARHLLTRSGFGAAPQEIQRLLPLSREAAVEFLLDSMDTTELVPPPAFLAEPMDDYLQRVGDYAPREMLASGAALRPMASDEEKRLIHQGMQEMEQLRVWWLDQMISTRSPLAERIALFWHNHFTTKYFDVLTPRLMFDELQLERKVGTRNFAALLRAMMRDPAMLIFLDNSVNTRKAPNENFARELLELFTLGIGHYTEHDVKELARMLAGHSVDFGGTWKYKLRPEQFDRSSKTFLGKTGDFDADDAARLLLANPRTAQFLTEKFYREFISTDLDVVEVDRLASVLRTQGYEMKPFLRAMFLSEKFWSDGARGQLVKSPVELLVGFTRTFDVYLPDVEILNTYTALLGQELFEPPSVEGWKGGMNWLSAQSVDLRHTLIERLWLEQLSGSQYRTAGRRDLVVRYSSETAGPQHAAFSVRVNGREVWRGVANDGVDTNVEGRFGPKPAWQTLVVSRKHLPHEIRTVDVVFEKQDEYPNLFINWVQVDGQRLPSHLAKARYLTKQKQCLEDGGDIPVGMMYCSGVLQFSLPTKLLEKRTSAAVEPSLYDRANGPVNTIIEYGTVRMHTAMQPAARKSRKPEAVDKEWSALIRTGAGSMRSLANVNTAQLVPAISAASPLGTRIQSTSGIPEQLKALTLDPAYNLK